MHAAGIKPIDQIPHLLLNGHHGAVHAIRYTKNGDYVMTCSDDRTIILWNPIEPDPAKQESAFSIKTYSGVHGYSIYDLAISDDNSKFTSVGGDKQGFLWDVTSGSVLRKFQYHTQRINTVALNQEATIMLTGSYDSHVAIWDLRASGRDPLQVLRDSKDSITSVSITDRGKIISASVDGAVRIYDIRAGKLISDNRNCPITSCRAVNNESCTLSCCLNNCIYLSEISSGDILKTYTGHKNTNYKIESVVLKNNSHMVSGSEDGSVYVWDLLSAELKGTKKVHQKCITTIANHPDQNYICTGSLDGTAACWKNLDTIVTAVN